MADAVQLRSWRGTPRSHRFGDDEIVKPHRRELRELGVHVEGRFHPEPRRRAFVHLDSDGERTITVLGPRLGPRGREELPWHLLDETDAVYVTAGDVDAVRHARRARVLVATPAGSALSPRPRAARRRYERGGSASATAPATSIRAQVVGARSRAAGEGETASGEQGRWARGVPGPVRELRCLRQLRSGRTYGMGPGWEIAKAVELAAAAGACSRPRAIRRHLCSDSGNVPVGRLDRQPSFTHACSPPSRLCAWKPAAANAWAASADLLPERQ